MKIVPIIGLEIHAELNTKSKIFCPCENGFGGEANTRICPVCTGMPGTLPVLNAAAVEKAVKAGLALGCEINLYSAFDRKNYFYPDLPKAYQITQNRYPICGEGVLCGVGIERIHIEEDAGKLIHRDGFSYPDYNRCGVPLIEIVTKPDVRDTDTASEFLQAVAARLKYADVCDAKMEQGSLRCDVNISMASQDGSALGERVEIKNVNSFRFVKKSIEYEITRQCKLLENGEKVLRETRRFDAGRGITVSMRGKEGARDYRYFPEPDIPPLVLTEEYVDSLRNTLPRMPEERIKCYMKSGLDEEKAKLLVSEKVISDIFDAAAQYCKNKNTVYSLLTSCMDTALSAERDAGKAIGECAALIESGSINRASAAEIFKTMMRCGGTAECIAKEAGFIMSRDRSVVSAAVCRVLQENPTAVSQYRAGKDKVLGFLIGRTAGVLGKGANAELIREEVLRLLKAED